MHSSVSKGAVLLLAVALSDNFKHQRDLWFTEEERLQFKPSQHEPQHENQSLSPVMEDLEMGLLTKEHDPSPPVAELTKILHAADDVTKENDLPPPGGRMEPPPSKCRDRLRR